MARRPGLYYGWVQLVALSITETTSWGILYYSFSVFLTPMAAETGWSRAEMTGAFSVALLISGLAATPVGRWIDRRGPRLLMTVGSCFATALVFAWSQVATLLQLYVVFALIGFTMAAVLYEPAFAVVAKWFVRLRGRALTVLTFLAGFASVIYIPLSAWLISSQGWRGALVTLTLMIGFGTIPLHALLLRNRPEDLGLLPDGDLAPTAPGAPAPKEEPSMTPREALRDPTFWWLTAAFFLIILSATALTVHLIPYLIDLGYDPSFAAWAAGLVGILALPGRLVFTPLGDLIPRRYVTAAIFLCQASSVPVLLLVPGTAGVIGFVLLFGAGFGAITPARVALIADIYGRANYGTIGGVLASFVLGARSIAPVAAGMAHDLSGTYVPTFWALTALSVLAAVAVLKADSGRRV
jgi:MFS family permease